MLRCWRGTSRLGRGMAMARRPAVAGVVALALGLAVMVGGLGAPGLLSTTALGSGVDPTMIQVTDHPSLGSILVDGEGMTLYMFANDEPGQSNCAGPCAEAWPPLVVGDADLLQGHEDLTAELGVIERADGQLQVTFADMPLYYFAADGEPGDVAGQGVGDVWFVLAPDGAVVRAEVSAAAEASTEAVDIRGFNFRPGEITVAVGTTVTWTNQDEAPHTVTSAGDAEVLDSGTLPEDAQYEYTFTEAGTYEYECIFHPGMDGGVVVQD